MHLYRACPISCGLLTILLLPLTLGAEDLASTGWRLWRDERAAWRDDKLHLPSDVSLDQLPINPPTGGWSQLTEALGKPTKLPSTVEEHFWGATTRPYVPSEYRSADDDKEFANGNYLGVSWWWRTFNAPALQPGQRMVVRFRGARLRSEVYCNEKLCAYTILPELPFHADITAAVRPGENRLAIRITDPGGRLDWRDSQGIKWGSYDLPGSMGFGGLDAGIELEVINETAVTDLAVLNLPNLKQVELRAEVTNTSPRDFAGKVLFTIWREGNSAWTGSSPVQVKAGATAEIKHVATVDSAEPWDLQHPNLYRAKAELQGQSATGRQTEFGFRFFTATGIGDDAKLTLNGRRIVLISSISWGFWGPNGLWPTTQAAEREVDAAAAFGFNCLQSHRNLSKPIVLDLQDRRGLLRYEEPGSGKAALGNRKPWSARTTQPDIANLDTSGEGGDAKSFAEAYEEAKIMQMVRRDRSHPSMIIYCIQNELGIDLREPRIYRVLRKAHAIDPSRTILLKSGIPTVNQAYMLPWEQTVRHDDGTGFSGWADQHTVGGPGTYMDSLYKSPDDFSHSSTNRREIIAWGEMLGSGTPDDHEKIVADYRASNTTGYDRADHERILSAYDRFIDQHGFRAAFPTASSLFQSVGHKSYFQWQKMIENCRISDPVDFVSVSGWESTTLENHSGLLDAHRNFKTDPKIIRQATEPFMLVVRPRHLVLARGETAIVDVHVVNEINRTGKHRLDVIAVTSDGTSLFKTSDNVELRGGEVFGQLLRAGYEVPAHMAGTVTITATLTSLAPSDTASISRIERLEVIDPAAGGPPPGRVVVLAPDKRIAEAMTKSLGITALGADALTDSQPLDAIVLSFNTLASQQTLGAPAENSDDPALYQAQTTSNGGTVAAWRGMAAGPCKVELFLSEPTKTEAAQRVFDVALNGQVVATDLDPFVEAGGRNRALVKTYTIDTDGGAIVLSVPSVRRGPGTFAAARLTDGSGRILRSVFRSQSYTDPSGEVWAAYSGAGETLNEAQLDTALRRVSEDGARLVLWPDRGADARTFAQALAARKLIDFHGMVGTSRAAWMGSWYFVRKHPLFDGLPSDCATDWRYQIPRTSTGDEDGLLMTAPGMQVIAGYGRDHDPNIGIAAAVIPHGKGRIVILTLPAMKRALSGDPNAPTRAMALRLLANSLR